MSPPPLASVGLALALAVSSVTCQSRAFTDADRAAIERVLVDQALAWNRGDLEAFMSGYDRSPDLVFTSGGNIRRGFEEARARYQQAYGDAGTGDRMGTLAFELLEIRDVGPDAAVVLGRWELTATEKAGHGVFSLVFQRRPAGWKVIHDHTSSADDLPASEADR